MARFLSIPRKLAAQIALLRQDPVAFSRNMMQFTHKSLFEQRLIDILNMQPMHVRLDPDLADRPALNVLNSALSKSGMTGGPNTIVNLAVRVAQRGVPVRIVTTLETSSVEPEWFSRHFAALIGSATLPQISVVSAAEPGRPLPIGANDVFMGTHWTTVQQLKTVLPKLNVKQFFYMLQEFEPSFYAWSSNYACALETYGMDFWPIFNESILAEFFYEQKLGRFADPTTRERAIVFEPAIDERLFHAAADHTAPRPKRLLFYARPSNTRNMFGVGLTALRRAAAHPAFASGWEFLAIGSRGSLPDLALANGHMLRPAPWMDYEGYARLLRQSDVLLCPMLSPHTSYPVLEMAACGGLAVTNSFATKTEAALSALSGHIIAGDPTIEAMEQGIVQAAERINRDHARTSDIALARDWAVTLDPAADRVADVFRRLTAAAGA